MEFSMNVLKNKNVDKIKYVKKRKNVTGRRKKTFLHLWLQTSLSQGRRNNF